MCWSNSIWSSSIYHRTMLNLYLRKCSCERTRKVAVVIKCKMQTQRKNIKLECFRHNVKRILIYWMFMNVTNFTCCLRKKTKLAIRNKYVMHLARLSVSNICIPVANNRTVYFWATKYLQNCCFHIESLFFCFTSIKK